MVAIEIAGLSRVSINTSGQAVVTHVIFSSISDIQFHTFELSSGAASALDMKPMNFQKAQ